MRPSQDAHISQNVLERLLSIEIIHYFTNENTFHENEKSIASRYHFFKAVFHQIGISLRKFLQQVNRHGHENWIVIKFVLLQKKMSIFRKN